MPPVNAEGRGAHPDRFCEWIIVDPRTADACAEVERGAGQPGRIGVGSHPFMHRRRRRFRAAASRNLQASEAGGF
jgi:predicted TIM-barrel fold metal-dependent hydrolase